ncbi:LytTR family DNA-binding domain-containing protein [Clostridium subterminale]|uniref:Stage 0 sporulation protein A homolog n=1 Tax=Clostridium subterminale TaxID=1550 RepID=A0ABN1KS88_CLOSU
MDYTIALCDDKQIQVNIISDYIKETNSEIKKNFTIITANSGQELLDKIKHMEVHVFFLDVEMVGLNGIELGCRLREMYNKAVIVYVTGFKDYAFNAFEIRAFHYIIKPLSYEKFKSLFYEVLNSLNARYYIEEKDKEFIIENKGIIERIKYTDIYYFEKCLRKINVICKNYNIEFYGSFKTLKDDIDMNYFMQCHQSFIVNNDKISGYKNQEIYIEELNEYIPVSKSCIRDTKDVLAKQLFG